jgi:dephospho-CoA kinase
MYLIGLTGNIATGKSTVAKILAELGAQLIDADRLVHQLQRRGTPVYAAIVAEFGAGIVQSDGAIDRVKLGGRVFADPAALACLEAIVHPAVGQEIERQISHPLSDIVVIEAIKLIETGRHKTCNALWVVTAPYAAQLERLMRARGLSEAQARTRIEAQPPQAEKIALADVVIDNGGSLERARAQVVKQFSNLPSQISNLP